MRVAVQIDPDGRLADYLVTAYSHPAFVDGAVASVKKWRFEPARIHGSPRSATAEFTFNYEAEGVVVVDMTDQTIAELLRIDDRPKLAGLHARARSASWTGPPRRSRSSSRPTRRPWRAAARGGHVTVEFYIDEQGHVRMPSVDRQTIEANEELAAAAVTAVEQWQFEPPLLKGRPVLDPGAAGFQLQAPGALDQVSTARSREGSRRGSGAAAGGRGRGGSRRRAPSSR